MEILSSNYINVFIYIAPIIIIGLSILIFYLMKYKDKPRLYYIILIIVSILCTGVYTYLYLNIRSLETTTVSARIIRLYRDIARSNFYVLFVMCIPTLIRGLGFDIKKFNFSKDLKELNSQNKIPLFIRMILTLIETFYRKRRQAPQPRTGGFYGFPARPGRAASGSATFF